MKVIDLLDKIAKGEAPKIVKVLDQTLLPKYQTLTFNKDLEIYEYCDGCEFNSVLDKFHLNDEVEIIEDTTKEDKKIEPITLDDWVEFTTKGDIDNIDYMFNKNSRTFVDKINEIIDRLNGE